MGTADSLATITCPVCESEFRVASGNDEVDCPACGQRLSLPTQFAFRRGEAAFQVALDELGKEAEASWRPRTYRAKARPDSGPLDTGVVRALQQAHAGLSFALRQCLPEEQRRVGTTMIADLMRLLAPRGMASPLEAEYWTKSAIALATQNELNLLDRQLVGPISPVHLPRRWRLALRRRQLVRTVARLEAQLGDLERTIGFVELPQAR